MALVRVCDICRTELEKGKTTGYVEIDIYKPTPYTSLMFPTSVTLCENCFKKYVNETFIDKVETDLDGTLDLCKVLNKKG